MERGEVRAPDTTRLPLPDTPEVRTRPETDVAPAGELGWTPTTPLAEVEMGGLVPPPLLGEGIGVLLAVDAAPEVIVAEPTPLLRTVAPEVMGSEALGSLPPRLLPR